RTTFARQRPLASRWNSKSLNRSRCSAPPPPPPSPPPPPGDSPINGAVTVVAPVSRTALRSAAWPPGPAVARPRRPRGAGVPECRARLRRPESFRSGARPGSAAGRTGPCPLAPPHRVTAPPPGRYDADPAVRAGSRQPLGEELRQGRIRNALGLNEQRRLRRGLERIQRQKRPPGALSRGSEGKNQLPGLGVRRPFGEGIHVPNLIAMGDHPPWHGSPREQGPAICG